MTETRAGKYGRNLANWIDFTIDMIPETFRKEYRERFLEELSSYSLKPRKNGQPSNEGCIHELSDLVNVEISNPEQFAKLVKEGIHLMYQKQTSSRVLERLQKYLRDDI